MSTGVDNKPFGMREIKVVNLADTQAISLPAALELEWEEIVVSAEIPGNDALQGVVTLPQGVKGKFKTGGIPLNALALMTNHTYAVTGATPNEVATLEADSSSYPYFKVYGKSVGDEGDDVHVKLFKVKLTSPPKGTFKEKEFFMLEAEFTGVKVDGKAYDIVANETASALPDAAGSPSALSVSSSPTDGATAVAVDANMVLTFNNKLAAGAENGIILTTAAGVPVTVARTIDAARKVVTLNPSSNLGAAADHLVVIAGVTDIYGQALTTTVIDFETA